MARYQLEEPVSNEEQDSRSERFSIIMICGDPAPIFVQPSRSLIHSVSVPAYSARYLSSEIVCSRSSHRERPDATNAARFVELP